MATVLGLSLVICLVIFNIFVFAQCNQTEEKGRVFMQELNKNFSRNCNRYAEAAWAFNTDLDNKTAKDIFNKIAVENANFRSNASKKVKKFDYEFFVDGDLYRQFRFSKNEGVGGLGQKKLTQFQEIKSDLKSNYSTGSICSYEERDLVNCTKLSLTPDITNIMSKERDWNKLKYVWEEWRTATGAKMRTEYSKFVKIMNEAAKNDGYANAADSWVSKYTVDAKEVKFYDPKGLLGLKEITPATFRQMIQKVWNQVSNSLYKKLHAFVRVKLRAHYGPDRIKKNGTLPAHILGNMWAQTWSNIGEFTVPFPEQPIFDVSDSMVAKNWTILKMFQESENFFVSLGIPKMTQTFWEKTIMDKDLWGKKMVCHASAWDMCKTDDFRIKMCTIINMEDLITVHHEMGHTVYQMAYSQLPYVFRGSANAGFHEAIGDLIALSVATPNHLTSVLGLSPKPANKNAISRSTKYTEEQKRDINYLMSVALDKIAFLPFGFLMDSYRWQLFDGNITEAEMNAQWWKLREEIQGIRPPSGPRGEEYFDPGAKYHIPSNTPYVRYFVSFVLQFQFHKQLCAVKGHVGPLHTCNIYQDKKAGKVLSDALKAGFSKPWPLVLKELGGGLEMDASAIEEYFKPLIAYLDEQLVGECVGWLSSDVDPTLCNS